ncbi:MAG: DNA alkylation repair protein [Acidimicrobiia bacterium]|nr:DNA alkylation repair protein [Acidimicrobiia bacterium]
MAEPLKNMVGEAVVRDIADRVISADTEFGRDRFVADLMSELPALELKPRIEAVARRLRSGLSDDYLRALGTVVAVARQDPPIEGFAAWPLCTFVEIFGLDHPDESLAAMEYLTQRASCEFAIRPYLRDHWDKAYTKLEAFTTHDSAEVRRLPSEGTRPRLPWGANVQRLSDDHAPGLALLEHLRHDPDEVVRRSVANHLNDISKVSADLVVTTLERWKKEPAIDMKMVSHALRTLVKQGHLGAMGVLGYATEAAVLVVEFDVAPTEVRMGDHISLAATLESTAADSQLIVVDFVIHHINKSGATSPKVFKWKTLDLGPGERIDLSKRRLIQMASTRTYYPGEHRVELQVAGKVVAEASFEVMIGV